MNEVMEIARFGVVAGVAPAEVVAAAQSVEGWLAGQPGFVSRALLGPDEGGRWTDLVRWRSHAEAAAAGAKFLEEPACAGFLRVIDPATVEMRHLPIALGR